MASSSCFLLFILPSAFFLISGWDRQGCSRVFAADTFGFDVHHRFSDQVRRWTESRSHHLPGGWPEKGTVEYYAALAGHDRAIHGRLLSDSSTAELTFSDGNATLEIDSLGYLHYALVTLGTPNVTFLVALDTGSNLFWVPCDCKSCASTNSASYGIDIELYIYSTNMSSTSQNVPCNSSLCELETKCSGSKSTCPYTVEYASNDTSSSGFLVEDILYLTTEDTNPKVVKAPIVFGCGQVQTGSFLESAAPNGLFGLGMDNISVPSILSAAGFTSNSFSMCFGNDGIGRISFGDNGSSDQGETQFNLEQSESTYNISITGMVVGNSSINGGYTALVDSGTSFTYLADPAYTNLAESFNAQVQEERYTVYSTSSIPFEYCYSISSNETVIQIPDVNLTTKGGSQFPVTNPIIVVNIQQGVYVYCLAVAKSKQLNIIAQNFMTGLRVVFDRERMILGWKKFNCYSADNSSHLPANPRNSSSPPPSIAFGPSSESPKATKDNGNGTQVTVLTPSSGSHSSHLTGLIPVLLLLSLATTI